MIATVRLALFAASAITVLSLLTWAFIAIKDAGRQEERVERAAEVRKRLNDATLADTATARCLADPTCRLSDDGYRRD
jgi:hypothetical protein